MLRLPQRYYPDEVSGMHRGHRRAGRPAFQQRPAPETGDYFKAEWFHTYTRDPPRETLNIYGGSDYAVTSDGGDYTVHVVIGVDPENRMYLLDLWRGQTSSDIWIEAWCDLVKKWRPSFWAEEHGQIISGVGPFLERRAIERHAYTPREQFPSRGDKAVRARSISGRMAIARPLCAACRLAGRAFGFPGRQARRSG